MLEHIKTNREYETIFIFPWTNFLALNTQKSLARKITIRN